MILRRVIEHFRRQEWTAIAIDFVIVVLGVFVGIQVSNWNAARADIARGAAYLQRIGADVDADLAAYDDRLKFWGEVADYGAAGLSFAETGAANGRSQWELLLGYFQASQVAELVTTSATWDEMRGAGDLGLVADLSLRSELARYYTYAGNPALSERPAYRVRVREVVPLDVQNYIWSDCYGSDSHARQWFVNCAPPIDEARARAIVDQIRADAGLIGELRYWMSTMRVATRISNDRVAFATALKAKIEEKLAGGK
jgi:hypothetical protein